MEIKLGKLRFAATGLPLFENYMELMRLPPLHQQAPVRTIYRWDCATQRGTPTPPPATFDVEHNLHFYMRDARGRLDKPATTALVNRVVAAAGFKDIPALAKAFETQFPTIKVPVDAATLITPHTANYSFHITAFAAYNTLLLRPHGGRIGDHVFMSVPWHVYIQTNFDGACNGAASPGISGLLATGGGALSLNEISTGLMQQYRSDLEEAIAGQGD